jgi:hypothetical protein
MGEAVIFYLQVLVGMALVLLALSDVFQSVVLPRRTNSVFRLAPHFTMLLWPAWRRLGQRLQPAWRREDFLGMFAPLAILLLLGMWVAVLVLGYGLLLQALAHQVNPAVDDFSTAVYVAGTSLLTIGFGDYVPTAFAARLVTLVAGASGLTILALVISLAFNLYSAFGRREVLVLMLDARAGVPPSGVTMLETYARLGMMDQLPGTFHQYELWTAEMLDSHLAYPLLPFFRSSHDGQSWVSALGAVLDAATLLTTVVTKQACQHDQATTGARAAAEMMYSIGCHAIVDLTQLPVGRARLKLSDDNPGIDRAEFDTACARLCEAGFPTECSDATWHAFSERRSTYATRLNALARFFASPPTQWIGDRSMLAQRHVAHMKK